MNGQSRTFTVYLIRTFAVTVALLIFAAAAAVADVVSIPPAKDNTLYEDPNGLVSNGAGEHIFAGETDVGLVRRAVIQFDVAGNVPAGSTVTAITLTMRMTRTRSNTARDIRLFKLLADWDEGGSVASGQEGQGGPADPNGDATWIHTSFPSSFWTNPGAEGDYLGDPNTGTGASATTSVGGMGFYVWSGAGMVTDVQNWLDSPASNFGWIVIGLEGSPQTTKRFDSLQNGTVGNRPVLEITYTPPLPLGACCIGGTCQQETSADCGTLGGVFQGIGVSCTPNPCAVAMGACCATNGTCTEDTEANCTGGGGTYQGDSSTCGATQCPIILTPYMDALPIPPVATPVSGSPGGVATYDITMREAQAQVHSQLPATTIWAYDDGTTGPILPGPTIEATTDDQVTVNWINDLRELVSTNLRTDHYLTVDTNCIHGAENQAKTVVHLHGAHTFAQSDGYPELTFTPGNQDTYFYPNGQLPAHLWYHDHALGITRLNIYMGLAGNYLIRDAFEQSLNLPTGEFEVPLMIMDRQFNPDGSFQYPSMWMEHWFGDKILVNGKIWPYHQVKQGKYRFRILNASGSRFMTLSLVPPAGTLDFTVIGTEGGLLPAPVTGVSEITLGPAERIDVIVDFAGYSPGDEILLQNSAPAPYPGTPGVGVVPEVMKFEVIGVAGDTDPVPVSLRPITPILEGESILTRDFTLKKGATDACGNSPWLINDLHWDDITEYPELDTVEIWRFINDSGISHPMHMHLVMFQVLDRDGFTIDPNGVVIPDGSPVLPLPEEAGWKDTAIVDPGEMLRVIARFEDFKGRFAYHCHIAEHEDNEMMRQFETVQCGDLVPDPTEDCDYGDDVPGDGCSAGCDFEDKAFFSGVAAGGGTVELIVDGISVVVPTTNGDSSADLAAALAAAINANASLAALGITATAAGQEVIVSAGDITDVNINDVGYLDRLTITVNANSVWWSSVDDATGYDVVLGNVDALHTGGFTTTANCIADGLADNSKVFLADPAPGQGLWFLARPQDGGGNGTYDGTDPAQVASRDADIAASGNDCN